MLNDMTIMECKDILLVLQTAKQQFKQINKWVKKGNINWKKNSELVIWVNERMREINSKCSSDDVVAELISRGKW